VVVENGYRLTRGAFGSDPAAPFRYLKLFTAVAGVLFLLALRRLLVELGLGPARRMALSLLAGLGVSAWFHFSAFETHCLAASAVALHLVSLAGLRAAEPPRPGARAAFVAPLVAAGWFRVDLFRLAAVSVLLPLLPALRRRWLGLAADLAAVAALGFAGLALMAWFHLGLPPEVLWMRDDRLQLEGELARAGNLTPANLWTVARAVTLYSFVMPVEAGSPRAVLRTAPSGTLQPAAELFRRPARDLLSAPLPFLAAVSVSAWLAGALLASVRRAARGDPLHAMLCAQAAAGVCLYTWFNPLEPFLWTLGFVPLWIAMIAEWARGLGRGAWAALWATVLLLAAHNATAFFLPLQ
jgi:hypothetical protein